METYQIVPWINDVLDPGIVANMYVPPGLEMLAREVLGHYDFQVNDMLLITSKPDKGGAIWKIGTSKGNLSIKCLHRRPRRSLFSVGAQAYMSGLGHRVPSFIPTKEGHFYVEAGGKLWIVTDWIEPLVPVSKVDLDGASQLCFGLGEFHKNSKGYVPPSGSEKSSRIYGWGKYYEKIIAKIGWFQDIALAYSDTAASANLLAVIEEFKRQANDMYTRFQNSPYNAMLAKGEPHWGLAHQDFGWSNGQMGPGGIWVIDLDGVSYDLPIRDLRKLITSTMDDMGVWDLTWIRGMIDAYHRANPLDQETFEILWIDMAFPNEFYKHVKEIVFNPQLFLDTELTSILQRVMTTESSKWQALTELEKDKANYAVGDYSADYVKPNIERPAVVLPGDLLTPIYSDMPVTPLTPVTPVTPVEPVVPAAPVEPVVPAVPVEPVVPATPIEPVVPAMPVEPVVPATPEEPVVPAMPVEPVVPATPVMPVVPATPVTPFMPAVEEIIPIPLAPKPIYAELPAVEEPVYAKKPVNEKVTPAPYTPAPVMVTIPSTRKPKSDYAKAPALSEPVLVPIPPETVSAGDPAADAVDAVVAVPPLPVFIQIPARGQKRFKLRVPRKRRVLKKTRIIKKTRSLKRRKLKRLTKWKRISGIKIIWGFKTWRAKKQLKTIRRPIKKQMKRKLGLKKPVKRVTKPTMNKIRQPQTNKNVPPPWKKRQIQSRKRTA
ncbi:CotS family spore coat protein [Paenibacillus sp. Soil766]|uniref:CotS family spore coat protein n=1 Tax=Paenibacillus sp. Soil766 TaxID=1736404 RepID=UPI0009E8489D|nr:CotS family spore coat protein [Paenibacillus sp. Soil766]